MYFVDLTSIPIGTLCSQRISAEYFRSRFDEWILTNLLWCPPTKPAILSCLLPMSHGIVLTIKIWLTLWQPRYHLVDCSHRTSRIILPSLSNFSKLISRWFGLQDSLLSYLTTAVNLIQQDRNDNPHCCWISLGIVTSPVSMILSILASSSVCSVAITRFAAGVWYLKRSWWVGTSGSRGIVTRMSNRVLEVQLLTWDHAG